jgi:hypothetical protein
MAKYIIKIILFIVTKYIQHKMYHLSHFECTDQVLNLWHCYTTIITILTEFFIFQNCYFVICICLASSRPGVQSPVWGMGEVDSKVLLFVSFPE